MKKNGFTLAEVLITLSIIGVVASLTLPALMTNTAEQQYKTGLRKGINTLTEAAKMNESLDGWGFDAISAASDAKYLKPAPGSADDAAYSMINLLRKRTSIDYKTTDDLKKGMFKGPNVNTSNHTVFFTDGSSLTFGPSVLGTSAANAKLDYDGLPHGFVVMYDTNGKKGPNWLSNCGNKPVSTTITSWATAWDNVAIAQCGDATQRKIKDQFALRLRGTVVQPEGAASSWVLNN